MRVLILGGSGLLGHKLAQRLSHRGFEVTATIRGEQSDPVVVTALPRVELLYNINAEDLASVEQAISITQPQAVANCIGIVKQLDQARDPIASISINALFPHRLSRLCAARSVRLIHFSTDCVFSGDGGPYKESQVPDARDLYGRTKLLGELSGPALTIRSSIIGPGLRGRHGLLDWFRSQEGGRVRGFARALYTGLTTSVMADLIAHLLSEWPHLSGVWQVASEPISKYDLLVMLRETLALDLVIDRDEIVFCDRRLDGSRFQQHTGWSAPSWREMVKGLLREDGLLPAK